MGATHSRKKKQLVKEGGKKERGEENGSIDNAEEYKIGGYNNEEKESVQINNPKRNIFDYKLKSIKMKYQNGEENRKANTKDSVKKCYEEEDYPSEFNPFGALEIYPESLDPFASEEEYPSVKNPFESDNIDNANQEDENRCMVNILPISDEEDNSGDPVVDINENRNNLVDSDAKCNETENCERFESSQIIPTNELELLIIDDDKKPKYSVGDINLVHNSPNESENTSNKIRDNENNNAENLAIDVSDNQNNLVTSSNAIENYENFENSQSNPTDECDMLIKDDKNKSKFSVADKSIIQNLFNESEKLSNTIIGKENSNSSDPGIDVNENPNSIHEYDTSLTIDDDKNKSKNSDSPGLQKIYLCNPVTTLSIASSMLGSGDQVFQGESNSKPPNSNTLAIHQGKNKKTSCRYKKKYRAPDPPNMAPRTQNTGSESLVPFNSSTTSSIKENPYVKQSKEVIIRMPLDSKSSVSHQEPFRKSISHRGKKRRAPDPPDKCSTMKNAECGVRHRIHRAAPPPPVAVPVNPNNVISTPESTQPKKITSTNDCRRKSFRRIISDLFRGKVKLKKDKENTEKLEKSKKSSILKSCD